MAMGLAYRQVILPLANATGQIQKSDWALQHEKYQLSCWHLSKGAGKQALAEEQTQLPLLRQPYTGTYRDTWWCSFGKQTTALVNNTTAGPGNKTSAPWSRTNSAEDDFCPWESMRIDLKELQSCYRRSAMDGRFFLANPTGSSVSGCTVSQKWSQTQKGFTSSLL